MNRSRKKQLEETHLALLEKKKSLEYATAAKVKDALELENQIKAIHIMTHAELDRGKAAYDRVKDQVGELYTLSSLCCFDPYSVSMFCRGLQSSSQQSFGRRHCSQSIAFGSVEKIWMLFLYDRSLGL